VADPLSGTALLAWTPRTLPVAGAHGPAGFVWLVPGLLGGTPFPAGPHDFEALAQVNTRLLVTLTEKHLPEAGGRYGIVSLHAPIADMTPPSVEQAAGICKSVTSYLERGEAVVFHCRAGKGRTGTLLAAQLVWNGATAADAIAATRTRNPQWIETDSQLAFLHRFEASMSIRTAR